MSVGHRNACRKTEWVQHGPALMMELSGVRIHTTAVIDPSARIAPTATVGPFCVIGPDVVIGSNVRIDSHAIIEGGVVVEEESHVGAGVVIHGSAVIGSSTSIFPYAVIGQTGQFPGHHNSDGKVVIEGECVIREFVIINKSVTSPATRVGRGCYLMARTQIDHDCILSPYVKTATGVTLGGSVHVEDHAYLGMNSVVHQGLRIGRACMIGMNGVVKAHVPPFTTLVDRRINRINVIGLTRLGASEEDITRVEAFYRGKRDELLVRIGSDPWIDAIENFVAQVAPDRMELFA
ncbi:DapH/DapD/GlmU-related protein [Methylobacterium sp. J-070]|uniref:DapH/DapD/GlmU-related protein n=1 Tax=Methylobacterium sp. J-070 TaxID=2836650 RepID=UPI001FB869DB|nr:DapH/DapD/GlmU-related protein [Methylobacterium sp. J-070]MCJ2054908.1 hypothetical protein [Methylobacterium sp. J-070]